SSAASGCGPTCLPPGATSPRGSGTRRRSIPWSSSCVGGGSGSCTARPARFRPASPLPRSRSARPRSSRPGGAATPTARPSGPAFASPISSLLDARELSDELRSELLVHLSPAQQVELTAPLALFMGVSKIAVALGGLPDEIPVHEQPTPDLPPQA